MLGDGYRWQDLALERGGEDAFGEFREGNQANEVIHHHFNLFKTLISVLRVLW
mgnify:CR=1 FL=1